MTLNNKVYNVLKWIALIALPALSTLVMSLGDIWAIPHKAEIALTITAVDTFLGVLLGISTASYKGEGIIAIDPKTEEFVIVFNDEESVAKVQSEGKITLEVRSVADIQKDDLPPAA